MAVITKEKYTGGVKSFSVIGECYIDIMPIIVNSSTGSGRSDSGSSEKCLEYSSACVTGNESACKILKEECVIEDKYEDDKITICKDSCSLDNKCYPFGYRKGGNYCSDLGAFTEQLESESQCENNFECGSNLCVSGQCVSEGLLQKIMNWFKKLFG